MLRNATSLLRKQAAVALARKPVSFQQVRTIIAQKGEANYADISARTGLDPSVYTERTVYIQKWPFCTSQSPGLRQEKWTMDFDYQDKWSNPLMGWTSVKDTLGTQTLTHLQFDSALEHKCRSSVCHTLHQEEPSKREEAVKFAEKHGMSYVVEEDTTDDDINELVAKDYGDNFRWDGDEDEGSTSSEYWACRRSGTK